MSPLCPQLPYDRAFRLSLRSSPGRIGSQVDFGDSGDSAQVLWWTRVLGRRVLLPKGFDGSDLTVGE